MQNSTTLTIPWKNKIISRAKFDAYLCSLTNQPHHDDLKIKAAQMAYYLGKFEQAQKLLGDIKLTSKNTFIISTLSAKILLALNTQTSNFKALPLLKAAKDHAPDEASFSDALANLGVAHQRIGLNQKAIELFATALASQNFNSTAFSHWASLNFSTQDEHSVLKRCDDYISQGIINSLILANRYIALSLLGQTREAESLSGINSYIISKSLEVPVGNWHEMKDFLSELTSELEAHPALRYGRHDSAIKQGWRIDELLTKKTPALSALFEQLKTSIQDEMLLLSKQDHPWLSARPNSSQLQPWCLFTEQEEHATWHIHPDGWMSGVFYIMIPEVTQRSMDKRGCIEFGPPTLRHIQREIPGKHRLFRPSASQLLLFPSHLYHRTYPTQNDQKRLVISFDIQPISTARGHNLKF